MQLKLNHVAAGLGLLLCAAALVLYGLELQVRSAQNLFPGLPPGGDFAQFWVSAKLIAQGLPDAPYLAAVLTEKVRALSAQPETVTRLLSPLYYPPVYLFFLLPLGWLPYLPALLVYFASTAALYLAGLWCLVRQRWIILFMLGFSAIWLNLVTGQNGLLTAGVFALALVALPHRPTLAGLLIGILCYKPHLGLLWPIVLLAGQHYRAFFFAIIAALGLTFASVLAFGIHTWLASTFGAEVAVFALEHNPSLWVRMPSLYATLRLQLVGFDSAVMAHGALSLTVAGLVGWIWFRSSDFVLRGAALAVGALLATPFVYDYDYALLGVALVLLLARAQDQGWRWSDKILLPLAYVWPILINRFPHWTESVFDHRLQLGFLLPLALLLQITHRVAVARRPVSALQPAA